MGFAVRRCKQCSGEFGFSRSQLESPTGLSCPRCGSSDLAGDAMPPPAPVIVAPRQIRQWRKGKRKTDVEERRDLHCGDCEHRQSVAKTELGGVIRTAVEYVARHSPDVAPDDQRNHRATIEARASYAGPPRYELSYLLSWPEYWTPNGLRETAHRLFHRRRHVPTGRGRKSAKRRGVCLALIDTWGNRTIALGNRLAHQGVKFPADIGPALRADPQFLNEFSAELKRCIKGISDVERLLCLPERRPRNKQCRLTY
jgi:DNA-directed RNA polymerase subunit RPC12/RpoP